MELTIQNTSEQGRILWLCDETVRLGAALDHGLRIAHISCPGMENLFYEQPADLSDGFVNPNGWRVYGGHRLWMSPESPNSYEPDNDPITWCQKPDGQVLLTQPEDTVLGIEKSIGIRLLGGGCVELENRIKNISSHPITGAVWGINSFAAGGTAQIPFAPRGENHYIPERVVSLWGMTNLGDPRLHFSKDSLTATYVDIPDYLKIGLYCCQGTAELRSRGQVFTLSFPAEPLQRYSDNGCNFELYMNQRFMELESLGTKICLQPGETTSHTEHWKLAPLEDF